MPTKRPTLTDRRAGCAAPQHVSQESRPGLNGMSMQRAGISERATNLVHLEQPCMDFGPILDAGRYRIQLRRVLVEGSRFDLVYPGDRHKV